jgi:hypothetical protein
MMLADANLADVFSSASPRNYWRIKKKVADPTPDVER